MTGTTHYEKTPNMFDPSQSLNNEDEDINKLIWHILIIVKIEIV